MDSLITAAARALAAGDPLGALKRVALRDDPPALALRGIAMAQLGDLDRAKILLRRAARAFGPRETIAQARCVVAEAEIALVSRDLGWPAKVLDAARATLEEHGDRVNAAHARYLEIRRLLLIGRLDEAERSLAALDPAPLPPASRTAHELVVAGIAIRRLRTKTASAALARARRAADGAGIPALAAEVESASLVLNTPAARLIASGKERLVLLEEVEALMASEALVVASRAIASRSRAASLDASDTGPRERDQARFSSDAAQCTRSRRAGATRRRGACRGVGLPRRRRIMVEFGPGAGAWSQPAHRAAGARVACGSRQGAVVWSRTSASLADPARAGIHDDIVTPRSAAK